jgi:hypothetical protein
LRRNSRSRLPGPACRASEGLRAQGARGTGRLMLSRMGVKVPCGPHGNLEVIPTRQPLKNRVSSLISPSLLRWPHVHRRGLCRRLRAELSGTTRQDRHIMQPTH